MIHDQTLPFGQRKENVGKETEREGETAQNGSCCSGFTETQEGLVVEYVWMTLNLVFGLNPLTFA